ncbi:MAG: pentapeptide repeat-containing protein, partial [Cyanobacteria bacterium P01_H01_bin.162]
LGQGDNPDSTRFLALLLITRPSSRVRLKRLKLADIMMGNFNDPATITTAQALSQAYLAGRRNFEGIILSSATLSGLDLKGADLSYADFSESDLAQTNLRGADLSYADLRNANLTQADLRGASLIGTDLRGAILAETNLQDADYDPEETHFPRPFDPQSAAMRSDR